VRNAQIMKGDMTTVRYTEPVDIFAFHAGVTQQHLVDKYVS